ncbi:MAG: PP2C family protein-serine/threonine phosphatase [Pirellulaceae bacterium]
MTQAALSPLETAPERMQCMEVWGGNCGVNRAFEMPGLEAWVFSRPHLDSAAGGDVYYVSSCASGRITRMLLADVSGHGPEVADLATGLRDLMRKNVNLVKQSRFVAGMNRQFTKLSGQGAFATALVATFFQPTRRLAVCNAGHPAPLLFDASENRWSLIDEPEPAGLGIANMPLGVHDQTVYSQTQMVLDEGDLVLFVSDALTESLDFAGNMLGMAGLLRLVSDLDARAADGLISELLAVVESSNPENMQRDDLTVLMCRATGTATTLRDNLLAPLRLFRSVSDNTVFR